MSAAAHDAAAVAADLARIVGTDHVVTDPAVTAAHCVDWTRRWHGATPAVVRPADTDEVAAVVQWCGVNGVAVVPQGGNTGLVGGSIPLAGEVVVHLGRLHAVTDVDPVGGQLTAGAGVSVAAVQQAARDAGWTYGVDLAARDTATVGGTIATNAGGLHVLRHGDTRAQLLGVEVVDGTGAVVGDLRGLVKDNTGYHLPSLMCGSEGTLGVVCRARLRLVPPNAETAVALLAVADDEAAALVTRGLRHGLADLSAVELFFADGLELVCAEFGLAAPFAEAAPAYVLVEAAGPPGVVDRLGAAVAALDGVVDAAVALDAARRAQLWRYRELHTDAIARRGVPHKLDVTVPATHLARLAHEARAVVGELRPDAEVWLFGHAGDGNLHVNITGVAGDDTEVDDAVLGLVASLGGSISAEHGIGRAKARWLHLNRTPAELAMFTRLRRAMDPAGILNPGVLTPAEAPSGVVADWRT